MINDRNTNDKIKSVKARIEKLIENGHLEEAKAALDMYDEKMPGDQDICSMRAVIHIIEGNADEAEDVLLEGLQKDSVHFDLLFNLAYIYEQRGQLRKAMELYCKAGTAADASQRINVEEAVARLSLSDGSIQKVEKNRVVFFVKPGMDSFLGDIIQGLSDDYFVRKIIVSDFRQIDEGMEWADVCWFEWCDELVIYGSALPQARQKKIICRLHSYEAFTEYIHKAEWENIDKVIFIADHIRNFVLEQQKQIRTEQTVIIPNGIDPEKYTFRKCGPGFNVAYVGYLNYKKGPMLLLHTFKALYDRDNRYKLYIAGKFQDFRDELYFNQMIKEFGIGSNVYFEGWQDDINHWLDDKNYILCTSLLESQNISVMQAMCKGIKPVIHNFVGARGIYPDEYIWNTVDEAVEAITGTTYESEKYREFVGKNYSLAGQLKQIREQLSILLSFNEAARRISDIFAGKKSAEELQLNDLTVLIPCYNRAGMLKDDLDKGLKLGSQPKLIVDDCSTIDKELLNEISGNKKKYNAEIIFKPVNEGLAQSRWTGLQHINTKYTAFVDDDDMLLCLDRDKAMDDISRLNNGYVLIVPRYLFNLYDDTTELGYDRNCYSDRSATDILRDIASKSEIKAMLAGGSIGCTENLRNNSFAKEFRVAEDFVMLSRLLSANPDMKVGTTESLVHVRRIARDTLSKALSPYKLAMGLIAQCIACYHCLRLGIASSDEVLEWMRKRAALIQNIYGFGDSFETELIAYLTGEISEEVFIHFLKLHNIGVENTLDELAPELKKMRTFFCSEANESEKTLPVAGDLPLVSIVIPTFNRRGLLKRAVDSALKQDYGNLEVVIMDNCSEDGTEEMVRSNYLNEKRIVYVKNERNLGPVMNSLKGVYEVSSGKYCLVLFDDDYLIDSSYIRSAAELLERRPDVVYVFGGVYHNDIIEQKVRRVIADQPEIVHGHDLFLNFKSAKYPIMPSVNTILFRRDIVVEHKCLQSPTNAVAGDMFFQLRMMLHGNVGFIRRIAVVYNLHTGSMSRNIDNRATGDGGTDHNKAVATAVDDVKGLHMIYEDAVKLYRFNKDAMDKWLANRIYNYLYWRLNETVQTRNELDALLNFVKETFPDFYRVFKDFTDEKYGTA